MAAGVCWRDIIPVSLNLYEIVCDKPEVALGHFYLFALQIGNLKYLSLQTAQYNIYLPVAPVFGNVLLLFMHNIFGLVLDLSFVF